MSETIAASAETSIPDATLRRKPQRWKLADMWVRGRVRTVIVLVQLEHVEADVYVIHADAERKVGKRICAVSAFALVDRRDVSIAGDKWGELGCDAIWRAAPRQRGNGVPYLPFVRWATDDAEQ